MQPVLQVAARSADIAEAVSDSHKRVLRSGKVFTLGHTPHVAHKTAKAAAVAVAVKPEKLEKHERNGVALPAQKVVKLVPPKIETGTIADEIFCTRPRRAGTFNISCETIKTAGGDKVKVDCYGHGGSGWTTLFGSVQRAIELFEKTGPSKATPIRVVGSGCMGYTTAIELARKGYTVAGIYTKSLYDSPSWRAAGYFATVSIDTKSEDDKRVVDRICTSTFEEYERIDKGQHPYLKRDCVRFLPVYCSADTESGVEALEERKLIPPKEKVTLDFGNGVQHKDFVRYFTYFMNTTTLMQALIAETNRLGIPVVIKEIASFDNVPEAVVFNCTGLGGRELNNDQAMTAVRGHLIALNEASGTGPGGGGPGGTGHMDYMIYTAVKQDGEKEYVYMFPKDVSVTPQDTVGKVCRAVLGGTFLPGFDKLSKAEQDKVDRLEIKRMLDRNSLFFHGRPFTA